MDHTKGVGKSGRVEFPGQRILSRKARTAINESAKSAKGEVYEKTAAENRSSSRLGFHRNSERFSGWVRDLGGNEMWEGTPSQSSILFLPVQSI